MKPQEPYAEVVRDARADWADADDVIEGRRCQLIHDLAACSESHGAPSHAYEEMKLYKRLYIVS